MVESRSKERNKGENHISFIKKRWKRFIVNATFVLFALGIFFLFQFVVF